MVFGKNNSTPFSGNNTNMTFIAEDCQITGTINIKANARIEGQVEGTVVVGGDLSIGPNANLNADIEAKTVSIAGQVRGDVKTSDYLELVSSARLNGDIYTNQLKIEQGASFIGTSHQSTESNQLKYNTSEQIKKSNETQEIDEESMKFSKKEKKK